MAGKNEQSLLISLDTLGEEQPDADAAKGQGDIGEQSGLIDLAALESAGLLSDDAGGSVEAPAFEAQSAVAVTPRRRGNAGMIAGIVIGALLLAAGGVFFGMQMSKEDPPQDPVAQAPSGAAAAGAAAEKPEGAAATPEAPAKAEGEAKAAAAGATDAGAEPEKTAAAAKDGEGDEKAADAKDSAKGDTKKTAASKKKWRPRSGGEKAAAKKKDDAEDAPPKVAAAPAKKPDPPAAKPAAKASDSEVDDMLGALNQGKPVAKAGGESPAAAADDPLLPDKLSRGQIMGVVRKNASAVATCKNLPPGGGGTVMVTMVIQGSGSVQTATVAGGKKGTALGNCVEGKVKVFRFPQFKGAPMRLKIPFAM